MQRAVFMDRDGVINATVWNAQERIQDSPYRLDDFRLLPGTAAAIRRIHDLGFAAVVISNQPGVAKGKCSPAFLGEVSEHMRRDLACQDAYLDGEYYCLHHPQANIAELRIDCDCRKPKPGLLYQAARDLEIDLGASYMVGDAERDIEAGLLAGSTTVLVRPGGTEPSTKAHLLAQSLAEAVEQVALREQSQNSSLFQASDFR
jgi:D,D-heptose 1,7-bisphosphate phosphatase